MVDSPVKCIFWMIEYFELLFNMVKFIFGHVTNIAVDAFNGLKDMSKISICVVCRFYSYWFSLFDYKITEFDRQSIRRQYIHRNTE